MHLMNVSHSALDPVRPSRFSVAYVAALTLAALGCMPGQNNGAGKTTALRIALGLIRPDRVHGERGRVVVDGFDAAEFPREARARQGGLIERPGFHPWMSGRANLILLARLDGLDRRMARTESDRLLEAVGLSSAGDRGAGDRAVGGYSQGMRQRLGIAQALLGDPAYVLLDEPTNGLDPEGIEEFRRLIVRLTRDEGRTVILSSHQLHEVAGVCDRIGIIRQGRMLVEAATEDLLAGGARRLRLKTDDDETARTALTELGIAPEPAAEGGLVFDPAGHAPAEISRLVVERGLALSELSPRTTDLESIYLRYSRGEAGEIASDAEPPPGTTGRPEDGRAPPFPVLRMLGSEVRRLLSHPAPALTLAIPAVVAGLAVLRAWSRAEGHLKDVATGAQFSHTLVTAFEGTAEAFQGTLWIAALLIAGLASQSLSGELSRGTLRNLLLTPTGRVGIALGKALGVLAACVACYLLLSIVAVGASSAAFDFTDVVEILETDNADPWVMQKASELWGPFLQMFPAVLLSLAAYAGLGFLAGAVARRGVTGLSLAAGSVAFLEIFRTVGREFGFERFLLSAHLPSPLAGDVFVTRVLTLIRASSEPPPEISPGTLAVPVVWLVVSIGLSILIVSRRSVP